MDIDQEGRITRCGVQGDGGEDDAAAASMSGYYRGCGVGEARGCARSQSSGGKERLEGLSRSGLIADNSA